MATSLITTTLSRSLFRFTTKHSPLPSFSSIPFFPSNTRTKVFNIILGFFKLTIAVFSSGRNLCGFQELNHFRLFSMAFAHDESPDNNPGLQATPDDATKGYFLQQTVRQFWPISFYNHFYVFIHCFLNIFVFEFDCRCFELRILKSV